MNIVHLKIQHRSHDEKKKLPYRHLLHHLSPQSVKSCSALTFHDNPELNSPLVRQRSTNLSFGQQQWLVGFIPKERRVVELEEDKAEGDKTRI